jgi:hypothetical protein
MRGLGSIHEVHVLTNIGEPVEAARDPIAEPSHHILIAPCNRVQVDHSFEMRGVEWGLNPALDRSAWLSKLERCVIDSQKAYVEVARRYQSLCKELSQATPEPSYLPIRKVEYGHATGMSRRHALELHGEKVFDRRVLVLV